MHNYEEAKLNKAHQYALIKPIEIIASKYEITRTSNGHQDFLTKYTNIQIHPFIHLPWPPREINKLPISLPSQKSPSYKKIPKNEPIKNPKWSTQ